MWKATHALAALAAILTLSGAQMPPSLTPDEEEIVVTGFRTTEGILINGNGLCRKLRNEPLDRVDASPPGEKRVQSVIGADADGGFAVRADDHPITGPDYWQRAGTAMDQYVFRATYDGKPVCIGGEGNGHLGYGQLRRVLDARPLRGKRVRFSAMVAARKATMVRFWLAAGDTDGRVYRGGNTNNFDFKGTHGWTPVTFDVGPIPNRATMLSYGFLLHGRGDVWLQQIKLEVLPMTADDEPVSKATIGTKSKKLNSWT
jgi:hypothetical protein